MTSKKGNETPDDDAAPTGAAVVVPKRAGGWMVRKLLASGEWVTCRFHQNGVAQDRWPIADLPTNERIGRTWGRGTYRFSWLQANGQGLSSSRVFTLDAPDLPDLPPYPNAPGAAAPPAPAGPTGPALAPQGEPLGLLSQLLGGKPGAAGGDTTVLLLQLIMSESSARAERAERTARLEMEMERERSRARMDEERLHMQARVQETVAFFQSMSRAVSEVKIAERGGGDAGAVLAQLAEMREELRELRDDDDDDKGKASDPLSRLLESAGPDVLRRIAAMLPPAAPNGGKP